MNLELSTFANRVIEQCGSTNDLARKLGDAGYPHGTWVSARAQDAGRGRLGRKWESQRGNLLLSILCRMEPKTHWSWVPLATAVGIAEGLSAFGSSVRIKWPNDLWLDGAKLGGILCEAVGSAKGSYIVIGIGLNCLHAPGNLDQETACLDRDPDSVRPLVIQSVLSVLEDIQARGVVELSRRYETLAALRPGTEIQWTSIEKKMSFDGVVNGLGESGELRVQLPNGEQESLFAEDVKVRRLVTPPADDAAR